MLRLNPTQRIPEARVGSLYVQQPHESAFGVKTLIAAVLLAAVACWKLPRIDSVRRLEFADRAVTAALKDARLRAIGGDLCVQVYFNSFARTFEMLSKKMTTPCGISGYEADGPSSAIDKYGAIDVVATNHPVFDSYGNAAEATIRLTAPDGFFRVIMVDAEGRITEG